MRWRFKDTFMQEFRKTVQNTSFVTEGAEISPVYGQIQVFVYYAVVVVGFRSPG